MVKFLSDKVGNFDVSSAFNSPPAFGDPIFSSRIIERLLIFISLSGEREERSDGRGVISNRGIISNRGVISKGRIHHHHLPTNTIMLVPHPWRKFRI
jgi:hypothetical protein